ncbi:MAG: hypothetical protein FRX49_07284 [Trebouxia sp. A1-2]|nr:MAG: hypothetical protein FRX49_07284 [Trebouxia sp. A1-2]
MGITDSIDAAYFWMPEDIPYGWLSHWYSAKMLDDEGNSFSTVEHYMMYHKAMLFGDNLVAQDILSLPTPGQAKAAGRRVTGFDKERWTKHREHIVFDGNFLKFSQHDKFKELLLETGNKPLVEASPEDKLWGIGFSAVDAAQHRDQWGQNLCGIAIEEPHHGKAGDLDCPECCCDSWRDLKMRTGHGVAAEADAGKLLSVCLICRLIVRVALAGGCAVAAEESAGTRAANGSMTALGLPPEMNLNAVL